jgi:parallel beta helix pectate lyase-like protein/GDSL-like lipase/acylhydrolase family protein
MKPTVFYISPDGDDLCDGLAPEAVAGSKQGPFATLEKARDAIREARKLSVNGCFRVMLRGGIYYLAQTFELNAIDSGTEGNPVVYAAYPGEKPIISGGRKINDWTEGVHKGKACWTVTLPEAAAGEWSFFQLFVNGQRRARPRFPKAGFYRFTGLPEGVSLTGGFDKGPDCACFKPGEISSNWSNLNDVELIALERWFSTHHKIKKIDTVKSEVFFLNPSIGTLRDDSGEGMARYWVENVFEALSEPGEWYLDRPDGKLYYLPFKNESVAETEVIAPFLEVLLRLSGDEKRPVAHVHFENIALQHAEWKVPDWYVGSVQAAYDVPGAVVFNHAEECVMYGCQVAHISQYGVEVARGSVGNCIDSCEITDMGAGGVRINHEWSQKCNSENRTPLLKLPDGKSSSTTVSCCAIHDGTRIYPGAIGIWIGNSGHNKILDNHVYNLNYTGISAGWTWSYEPTATVGNRIEGNHIHHINWDRMLSDNGGIYTLGQQPGGLIKQNIIHHIGFYHYGARGIYLDEGSSEITVEGNIVHHTRTSFYINKGRNNYVCNNIFALAKEYPLAIGRLEETRSCTFERNICYSVEGQVGGGIRGWLLRQCLVRDNLFWQEGSAPDFGDGVSLMQAQKSGQFINTIISDPLFADPEGGDFTLREDSPAFTLGFQPSTLVRQQPESCFIRSGEYNGNKTAEEPRPIIQCNLEWVGVDELRVDLQNCGDLPANGRIKLSAGPSENVRINGDNELSFANLAKDNKISTIFNIETNGEAEDYYVETIPDCEGLLPAYIYNRKKETVVNIPRVRMPSEAKEVTKALEKVVWQNVLLPSGNIVAKWRMAVADETLLFQAQVAERNLVLGKQPWTGSSIEFFAAPQQSSNKKELTQLFFVPEHNRHNLIVSRVDNSVVIVEPSIAGVCVPWGDSDGYELQLCIPLAILNINPQADDFLFEVVTNGTFENKKSLRYIRFFKADTAAANTAGYGKALIENDSVTELLGAPLSSLSDLVECTPRCGLPNFLAKCEKGKSVKVAYFGGSITEGAGWRVYSLDLLRKLYPQAKFEEIFAAIGGTGSSFGAFRLERDVLENKPDLLFVEFAVNDSGVASEEILRCMEGIIRNTWGLLPECDIIFVYTFSAADPLIVPLRKGKFFRSASVMEKLADNYGIPSIFMGMEVLRLEKEGKLVLKAEKAVVEQVSGKALEKNAGIQINSEEKIPFSQDGVHPYLDTGHKLYLAAIERSIPAIKAASGEAESHDILPTALTYDYVKRVTFFTLDSINPGDGWKRLENPMQDLSDARVKDAVGHSTPSVWQASPGAELSFSFKGDSVMFYSLSGPGTGFIEITIDGETSKHNCFDEYSIYWRLNPFFPAKGLDHEIVHTIKLKVLPEEFDKRAIVAQIGREVGYDSNAEAFRCNDFLIGGICIENGEIFE